MMHPSTALVIAIGCLSGACAMIEGPSLEGSRGPGEVPFAQPPALTGQARFLWSGLPRELRPNSDRITTYTFKWPTGAYQVSPSDVKRRRAVLGSTKWTTEDLTINAPPGYFPVRQFRDLSFLFDRVHARYFFAVSGVTSMADGWRADGFAIFTSSDGIVLDFVKDVPFPSEVLRFPRVWTPEFFVEPDGTVYVIVAAQSRPPGGPLGPWNVHAFRCEDPLTFAAWSYVGCLQGAALPHRVTDGLATAFEPFLLWRDGMYHLIVNTPGAAGATQYTASQLVVARSEHLLGPYDLGHGLSTPELPAWQGEGPSVVELPIGSAHRWRLYFDNFWGHRWEGKKERLMHADTDDFLTFTNPHPSGLDTYNRHCTMVIGL